MTNFFSEPERDFLKRAIQKSINVGGIDELANDVEEWIAAATSVIDSDYAFAEILDECFPASGPYKPLTVDEIEARRQAYSDIIQRRQASIENITNHIPLLKYLKEKGS